MRMRHGAQGRREGEEECVEGGALYGHGAGGQGPTLVHFSAQLERFHGIGGARKGCVAHDKGVLGGI